jgi:hypothetical protein
VAAAQYSRLQWRRRCLACASLLLLHADDFCRGSCGSSGYCSVFSRVCCSPFFCCCSGTVVRTQVLVPFPCTFNCCLICVRGVQSVLGGSAQFKACSVAGSCQQLHRSVYRSCARICRHRLHRCYPLVTASPLGQRVAVAETTKYLLDVHQHHRRSVSYCFLVIFNRQSCNCNGQSRAIGMSREKMVLSFHSTFASVNSVNEVSVNKET